MNVSSFLPRQAPDEPRADNEAARTRGERPEPDGAPGEPGLAPAPLDLPAARERRSSAWSVAALGAGVGAFAGALSAIAAVMVYAYLNPPMDRRFDPLAQKLTSLDATVQQLSTTVGTAQNDVAQALDLQTALAKRLDGADAGLTALQHRLDSELAQQKVAFGVGSPIFAVAVAQLRGAFLLGGSFEAELVNVYTLAKGDPRAVPSLQVLVGPARVGVPSLAGLRQQLASLTSAAGLQPSANDGFYGYSLSLVSKYIGYSSQPYQLEAAIQVASRADALLAQGDLAGAVAQLSVLRGPAVVNLQPWMDAARRRVNVEGAIKTLTDLAASTLSEKMKDGKAS
jgi:hypothetical protein